MRGGEVWAAKDGRGCVVYGGAWPRTDEIETNDEPEPERPMHKGRRDISCGLRSLLASELACHVNKSGIFVSVFSVRWRKLIGSR